MKYLQDTMIIHCFFERKKKNKLFKIEKNYGKPTPKN